MSKELIERLRWAANNVADSGIHKQLQSGIAGAFTEAADMIEQLQREKAMRQNLLDGVSEQLAAAQARIDELEKDAMRYRWLRRILEESVGGGVEVNDQRLVYEEPDQGEAVRVFWYPNTPIGFYESKADSLDEAIDKALAQTEVK